MALVHPDLGIGGAERLMVDFALALKESGYQVKIFTAHHDKNRCFSETIDGRLQVETVCNQLPRSTYGRFHALWAYLKVFLIGLYLTIFHRNEFDIFLIDQVPSCLPPLKLLSRFDGAKIVYYCHFPDMLLTERRSFIKRVYRYPIDKFEGWSIGLSDLIMVNSIFTAGVVKETFDNLRTRQLKVLYPCVNLPRLDQYEFALEDCSQQVTELYQQLDNGQHFTFLSLNRFEPKKDVALAIKALRETILLFASSGDQMNREPHLIIAGGYDPRVSYCVEYLHELQELVRKMKLESNVTFIKSPSDHDKLMILKLCDAVIYTPTNEHFGIVPLEAMAMGRPVIACNSGGPKETVKHKETGYLAAPTPESFASYMCDLIKMQPDDLKRMGDICAKHVRSKFTFDKFQQKIELKFDSLLERS